MDKQAELHVKSIRCKMRAHALRYRAWKEHHHLQKAINYRDEANAQKDFYKSGGFKITAESVAIMAEIAKKILGKG